MKLVMSAAAAVALLASAPALADKTLHLNMTFASGAEFDGDVTFVDDYSKLTNVSGILTNYEYPDGYTGTGSSSVNWIWNSGANWISGNPGQYADWLMNGPGNGYDSYEYYSAYILLAYDYSGGTPTLLSGDVETAGGYYLNSVNASDRLVSGHFSTSGAVPEPASWALMVGGFGLVGGAMRTRRKVAVSFG